MNPSLANEIERVARERVIEGRNYPNRAIYLAALSEIVVFAIQQAAERMCPYCADSKKLIFEAPSCFYHDLSRWVGQDDGTDAFVKCYEICKAASILSLTNPRKRDE